MNGNSVVIAPNILEDMANDPEKAAYYEQKIDDFFNATPRLKAQFAAQGLNYEPCGVVIHEDGSVLCGGTVCSCPIIRLDDTAHKLLLSCNKTVAENIC